MDLRVTVVVTIGAVGIVFTGCIAAYIAGKACTEVLVIYLSQISILFYYSELIY